MTTQFEILCIGSVLWDVIGRSSSMMRIGSDVPGKIQRIPGGVAMNIAMTLSYFGMRPVLLSVLGHDPEGDQLITEANQMGLVTDYIYRTEKLPTDFYMAIEGKNGLISAIADAHSLERADEKILRPLEDGRLGSSAEPYKGMIALDGNLTSTLLQHIANSPLFSDADLRVAPASPGKADRLLSLLDHPSATLYVNLEEAGLLCQRTFKSASDGAEALIKHGAKRVLVTNGNQSAAEALNGDIIVKSPPKVNVSRITGAGDTFMAMHIISEAQGMTREKSLERALEAAAIYVSGETPK